MISKQKLFKHIDSFPDQMHIEELIEKLLLIDKIEKRIAESDKNDTISEEQLDAEIKSW
jgi:hypothetical protein